VEGPREGGGRSTGQEGAAAVGGEEAQTDGRRSEIEMQVGRRSSEMQCSPTGGARRCAQLGQWATLGRWAALEDALSSAGGQRSASGRRSARPEE
jgi:hypothetical protein